MTTNHGDTETAAREALVTDEMIRAFGNAFYGGREYGAVLGYTPKQLEEIDRDIRRALTAALSARPTAPDAVDRERVLCAGIARGFTERGRFGVYLFETEAENEAYKTGLADAGNFIAEDIEAGLPPALRPASHGEVTVTEAMVEAALSASIPGRGQVRSQLPRTKPGECASITIMRAALTAALSARPSAPDAVAAEWQAICESIYDAISGGFMTCQSGGDSPKVVIEFRELAPAQECHEALVRLGVAVRDSRTALNPTWQATGKTSSDLRGHDETEWIRPHDGTRRMFPRGFNPNSGCYEGMVFMIEALRPATQTPETEANDGR